MSTELVNGIYLIKNTGSGKYLNVWGIDQVGNSRNVNQYDLSAELSQVFWVQKTTTGVLKLSSIIKDANGAYYSLNVNTNTFNANLYKETAVMIKTRHWLWKAWATETTRSVLVRNMMATHIS